MSTGELLYKEITEKVGDQIVDLVVKDRISVETFAGRELHSFAGRELHSRPSEPHLFASRLFAQ